MLFFPSAYYRMKARAALKNHWLTALLIALIVNLPTLLAQAVAAFTGNDPVDRLQSIIISASRDGIMSPDLLTQEISEFLGSSGFLAIQGLLLAALLVTPCLMLGMNKWMIDRLRNQPAQEAAAAAFSRARFFFRALGLQVMVILKVLLWMLPGIAVMAASMIPLYTAGTDRAAMAAALGTANSLMFPALLVLAVPGVMAALRYAMAEYLQADRPETGIMACIRRSKELMLEQKKSLFFLMVSFLLWYLLEMLVTSMLSGTGSNVPALMFQMLAGLAINVYMSASVAAFYLVVTGEDKGVPQAQEPEKGPESGT